jgi:uncharacterized protein (TIGR02145 family)
MNNLFKIVFFILLSISVSMPSCKKTEETPLVKVTTDPVSQISRTSARGNGSIINEGADTAIYYGFCWSTRTQPTIDDNMVSTSDITSRDFNAGIGILSPGTTYYVRAYAITVKNKIYGNQESFTTKPATALTTFNPQLTYQTVSDIDGNTYKTIKIGTQEWLAENLKTTRLNDGTAIPLIADDYEWSRLNTPAYCWYYNDEAVFKNIYGGYYNWYTVSSGKLCPAGWHVPGEDDWKVFKLFLGMTPEQIESQNFPVTEAGNKIKETGTHNWVEESVTASNESGFTALPGGSRGEGGDFGGEGGGGGWWSATQVAQHFFPISHWVVSHAGWIFKSEMVSQKYGLNVRCVKD